MTLRPVGEVQAEVLDAVSRLNTERRPLADVAGAVLAESVVASDDVPPFANTAMDGYAVRAQDTASATEQTPTRLDVVGELPAGRAPTVAVGPGEAIRIMTGAPMPPGADAIVMVERTERAGADGVAVRAPARTRDHIRDAGGDVRAGDRVFEPETVLGPAHIGVLATLGISEVSVWRRARVGVLSTGDELVDGPRPLAPGEIRDSNRPMLLALAAEAGCEPVDLGVARDDEALIVSRLQRGIATCDALLTSGGVSVGDYDYVKAALDRLGALVWSQVAIRPAKPLAFGVVGGTPVFGLPGNPVSSLVSFELFARPALLKMSGHAARHRPIVAATAAEAMPRRRDGKLHLDRVHVHLDAAGGYRATRAGAQASNALSTMATADGLALLADGDGIDAGDTVRVMLLRPVAPVATAVSSS
ncbi:MAG TPA: gephyrin-like molybdotransferase Glp [Acidimicrobiia bacterium]|nr:gephyrin-like molybdotransferase Glp [Acidimicrobiia bacterium]